MIIVRLQKAKYIKRWRGKDGRYKYLYKQPPKRAKQEKFQQDKPRRMKKEDLPGNVIYHTSPDKITSIEKNAGTFDDVLFFANKPYAMGSAEYTYAMDADKIDLIDPSEFYYNDDYEKLNDIVKGIMAYADIDKETAQDVLGGTIGEYDVMDGMETGEFGWYIQQKQGEAAKLLGYDGAVSIDEQGSVYIIPMFGREGDLIEVEEDVQGKPQKETESSVRTKTYNEVMDKYNNKTLKDSEGNIVTNKNTAVMIAFSEAKDKTHEWIQKERDKIKERNMKKSRIIVKSIQPNSVECQKLAKKHGVSVEHIQEQLDIGKKEEMEHTDRQFEARKIALEHLSEDPDYYTKLKDAGLVEKALKTPEQKKFDLVMHEFEVGALKDSHGNFVTDKDQALAIAYSESGMSKSRVIVKSIIVKARNYKDKLQRLIVRKQNNIASPAAEYDHKYKLQGNMSWHGLNIAIENKKGSYRRGKDADGKPWKTYMNFDYGRIGSSKAVDNEGVDIYIGPDDTAEIVYVVHQQDPFKKCYDECKSMLNFPSRESAIEGYLSQYDRPDFLGPVSEFTIPEFKTALKEKRGTMLYNSPNQFRKSRIIVRKL